MQDTATTRNMVPVEVPEAVSYFVLADYPNSEFWKLETTILGTYYNLKNFIGRQKLTVYLNFPP